MHGDHIAVGKSPANDIVLSDSTVSRVHAVMQRVGGGWAVADLTSRNGTFVNGVRIQGTIVLRPGDEIRLGAVRATYKGTSVDRDVSETAATVSPPRLTRREEQALLALCRPVLTGSMLSEPARIDSMAAEMFVSESAVKKHLQRLYDKFDLHGDDRRRGRLAAEAIARGAVSLGRLPPSAPPTVRSSDG